MLATWFQYPEKYGAASIKKAKAKKKADKFGAIMHDRQSLFDDDEDDFDDEFKDEGDQPIDQELEGAEKVTATDESANSKSNRSKTNQTEYEDLPPMPPW